MNFMPKRRKETKMKNLVKLMVVGAIVMVAGIGNVVADVEISVDNLNSMKLLISNGIPGDFETLSMDDDTNFSIGKLMERVGGSDVVSIGTASIMLSGALSFHSLDDGPNVTAVMLCSLNI